MPPATNGPSGLVIGTAGHIDHGKTSLVRGLTGMDTDRLAEEKRRGISIDLGFAHLPLPNGRTVSFIDVPGHERFIRNMLAGAGGIQAVMLIVAANESVMPQTREHLAICRLLGIRYGFVVLTKTDLADETQTETARQAIRQLCSGSFLADAPIVPVDSVRRQGFDSVVEQLVRLTEAVPPIVSTAIPRLAVDRSFAAKGFGAVVTGTLAGGRLRTGDTVAIHPTNQQARIRGLQVHGAKVEIAEPGERTAINLAGVDHTAISRGNTLTTPSGPQSVSVIDVQLNWLDPEEARPARQQVLVHIGTAEVVAGLKLLRRSTADTQFGRLWLEEPVLAVPGDRLVLREPSPARTIAGATVIDVSPPVRLNRAKTAARLEHLSTVDASGRIEFLVREATLGRTVRELIRGTGLLRDEIVKAAQARPALLFHSPSDRVLTKAWLAERRAKLLTWLAQFHKDNPSAAGAPTSAARLGLPQEIAAVVLDGFPHIRIQGDCVAIASFRPQWNEADLKALDQLELAFRKGGFQPPAPAELLPSVHPSAQRARALLDVLLKSKKLIRVSGDVIFHAEVIMHIRESLAAQKGRRFSVPEFKTWTQISRKYAIPLLEYLDNQHVTRREGDNRVVL